jgi:hypothetical protein
MTKKILTLFFVIGFASICAVQAQSPSPGESPAGAPSPAKQRTHKKAKTTASPAEAAESPSPAASPATSPKAKRGVKKAEPSPSPSPAKFSLGDLFKPKSSAAASPAPVSRAPAKNASAEAATNPPAPGGGHGLVWVNTESHVYHREGSRFYGTTKKGKYMTEAEAIKEGNKAAGKGQ